MHSFSRTSWMMLVLLGWVGCGGSAPPALPPSAPHALNGQVPPPQREPSLDGSLVELPASEQITVINFWATWCEPCEKSAPVLEALHRGRRAQGVAVVGVAADDNPGLVQEKLRAQGVTYPNIVDFQGALRGIYRVADLPQTFVVDRRGRVRVVVRSKNEANVASVQRAVDALIAEGP